MILCVDPDPSAIDRTRETLASSGFEIEVRQNLSDSKAILERDDGGAPECVVTEYDLGDGTGLELIEYVRETMPDAACILYTQVSPEEMDTSAFGTLVAEYVPKGRPGATEDLLSLVRHSLRYRSQTAYPLPDDEDERLAALEQYPTDAPGLAASLDRLTELATALFGVQSAGVGLIDSHEQQFVSCYGASFGDVEREETVCTHAILDHDVTVIEDVSTDPRFQDNDGLADADVEFYAGTPLVTPDDRAIGTFCIHDDEPRSFSDRDRHLLSLIADEAMEQLELRRGITASTGERHG